MYTQIRLYCNPMGEVGFRLYLPLTPAPPLRPKNPVTDAFNLMVKFHNNRIYSLGDHHIQLHT